MGTGTGTRRIEKILLFRRVTKGRRLCLYCLRHSRMPMFKRARRGTC